MDIPLGLANKSKSSDPQLEDSFTTIIGAKLERIRQGGRNRGKENVELQDSCGMVQGKPDIQEASLGVCPSPLLQSAHLLKRENVEGAGSCNLLCERGEGPHEGIDEDRMEVTEQDGSSNHQ